MKRRHLLETAVVASITSAGCTSSLTGASKTPAHTVSVYHEDEEVTRDVTVAVRNDAGETLFERSYTMSESNEADEDATFPESSDPATVLVTVDGTKFEKQWPNPDCSGNNWAGVEVWISGTSESALDVRIEGNCQHKYVES
ncbi:hypothetical protein M0R89_07570 [Halorussus limi]|uniref:Uncharacterized protein n=1 Tax=Halorussus limi TaxID=2938695 RepID=A0A8U0HYA7_9EURY|nr:hypothetical protein [Halorussus limi]UPV75907.1 hypothetical protein M0R89_07570 [Halorussus limi]